MQQSFRGQLEQKLICNPVPIMFKFSEKTGANLILPIGLDWQFYPDLA